MQMLESTNETILDALQIHADSKADEVAYTFLKSDGARDSITYRELDQRARIIARSLLHLAEPHDRALMMYPAGLEFIEAFLGCLYAGIVAVPAYPPKKNRNAARILSIAGDCSPRLLLCTSGTKHRVEGVLSDSVSTASVIATDELPPRHVGSLPVTGPDRLAFLQYTSGSTATPKGVQVTHQNMVANEKLIQRYFEFTQESIMVSWLPMFHDMGLIGGILAPLFVGFRSILMPPNTFLREPFQWLRAVTEFLGTSTGAPNFAYDLCVKKITADQKKTLDLSSLKIAYNGAEPIRANTLDHFAEAFASCGFNRNAMFPCYGMAETTLLVSGGPPLHDTKIATADPSKLQQHRLVDVPQGQTIVGCGQVGPDLEVRIVHPETCEPCQQDEVGEIWVHGDSVARGYWNRPEQSQEAFHARIIGDERDWFRTGDYGFLRNNELYVTGRRKDLIVMRGRNIYPQDIEQLIERHLGFLDPNSCVAFSLEDNGKEKLVAVVVATRDMVRRAKSNRGPSTDWNPVVDRLRVAILEEFEVALGSLVFVRPTGFPRTSSGKVQRQLAKQMLRNGDFEVVLESTIRAPQTFNAPSGDEHDLVSVICKAVREWAGDEGQILPPLDGKTTFASLGIDSMAAADLAFRLERMLECSIDERLLMTAATLEGAANAIENQSNLTASGVGNRSAALQDAGAVSAMRETIDLPTPVTEVRHRLQAQGVWGIAETSHQVARHAIREQEAGDGLNGCVIHESSRTTGMVRSGPVSKECVIWCINHYTGLNRHPAVVQAAKLALDRFGTGSGTSAFSGGRCVLHEELEAELAVMVDKPHATLFPTGYTANTGGVSAIAGPKDLILYDQESHASIVDGIKLSRAKSLSFLHNSVADLGKKLDRYSSDFENILVVNESAYSMSGDLSPLREIAALKKKYRFFWYVDEAHAFGIYGQNGAGLCRREGVSHDVDAMMSTLSKATATVGGFVAANADITSLIRYHARSYMFQACIPPADVAATLAALKILRNDTSIGSELLARNHHMRTCLIRHGFDLRSSESPIVPVYIPDDMLLKEVSRGLFQRGVFTVPVFYPAVKRREARLRFIVTRNHSTEQIDHTVSALAELVPPQVRQGLSRGTQSFE